jgi:hypothetical protein
MSLIPFGFECGDGWYDLIYSLSAKLEKLIQKFIDDNKGNLVCRWCWKTKFEHISCHNPNNGEYEEGYPRASQVKEKYGILRMYLTTGTDEMFDLIDEAEELSSKTCEICGKKGKLYSDGWCVTRCKKCYKGENK